MNDIQALYIVEYLKNVIQTVGGWFVSVLNATHMRGFFLYMFAVGLFVRVMLGPLLGTSWAIRLGSDRAADQSPSNQKRLPAGSSDSYKERISRR